jgi:hypothetical protein
MDRIPVFPLHAELCLVTGKICYPYIWPQIIVGYIIDCIPGWIVWSIARSINIQESKDSTEQVQCPKEPTHSLPARLTRPIHLTNQNQMINSSLITHTAQFQLTLKWIHLMASASEEEWSLSARTILPDSDQLQTLHVLCSWWWGLSMYSAYHWLPRIGVDI